MNDIFSLLKQTASAPAPIGPVAYLVVGLGNPGRQYDGTRHNVGFLTLDLLSQRLSFKLERVRFKSLCGEVMLEGKRVLFLKPSTFMNLSGQAVVEAMTFHKLDIKQLIVISDDVELAPGRIRIRAKGSAGGHNGLKNIIYLTGKDDFPRIKIGVGHKPHPDYDMADWVLSTPSGADKAAIEGAITSAADAVCLLVKGDIEKAMNLYNTAAKPDSPSEKL